MTAIRKWRRNVALVARAAGMGLAALGAASCATSKSGGLAEEWPRRLAAAATWEYGRDRAPLSAVEEAMNGLRTRADKAAAETALLRFAMASEPTRGARQFALRPLGRVGTAASADALIGLLADPNVAADAAAALDRMADAAVDARLVAAVPSASPAVQARLIRVLGIHRSAAAVPAIAPLLKSTDADVSAAAVRALGAIATPVAAEALIAAAGQDGAVSRLGANGGWDALMECLEAAVQRNDKPQAERIVRVLDAAPATVRAAARLATAPRGPDAAVAARSAEWMAASDPAIRVAGVELLRRHGGLPAVTTAARQLKALPADSQIALLGLIEDRRARAAAPAAAALACSSEEPAVRCAALRALGLAGDADSVAVLAEAAASGTAETRAAARKALRLVSGAGVEERLVRHLGETDGEARLELLRAAGDRGSQSAMPRILEWTASADAALRHEAIRQVGALAGPAEWSRLVDGLTSAADSDRQVWLTAVEAAAIRLPALAEGLPERWRNAPPPARAALLGLFGRLRRPAMLPCAAESARSADAAERHAALRALANWVDPSALPALMEAARHADPTTRRLAQRGLAQVIRQCRGLPADEQVRHAAAAAPLLENAEEQTSLLSTLANTAIPAAAEVAARFLDNAAVRAEAEQALLRIGRASKPPKGNLRGLLQKIAAESPSEENRTEAAALIGASAGAPQ